LGGIQRACAIVKRAQQMGVYVIVADYLENSPAKKIADKAVLIDATDVDALVKLCLDEKIDGVTTAYVDVLLKPCMEVAKRIGKPFYASDLMIDMATDKLLFKKMLNEYDVPVPSTYQVTKDNYKSVGKTIKYPVFVKPVDASGSRGANACFCYEDFCTNYEIALSFSKSKSITVEQLLTGTEFILDYLLIDGKAYLLSMADRHTTKDRPLAINHPNLMLLPSKNLNRYCETVDKKVVRMFEKLGFENGIIFLQGYADENSITFYEMGCRLGGTWPYIDEYFTGLNPIDCLVSHAVCGRMIDEQKYTLTPHFSGKAAVIYFLGTNKDCVVGKIDGVLEVENMQGTVCVLQYAFLGKEIFFNNQTDVLLLAVHIVADDYEMLKLRIKQVYSTIKIEDTEGNSIIADVIDVDTIIQ
jgi:biotin carboxylase